eukprot:6686643-Prymnesium_polylepis.1
MPQSRRQVARQRGGRCRNVRRHGVINAAHVGLVDPRTCEDNTRCPGSLFVAFSRLSRVGPAGALVRASTS